MIRLVFPHLVACRLAAQAMTAAQVSRGQVFAGLAVLGFANGDIAHLRGAVVNLGWVQAVAGTFGISVMVWVAFFACPALLIRGGPEPPTTADSCVAGWAVLGFLLPIDWLSWIALTVIAGYLLVVEHQRGTTGSLLCRGAWILLATTSAVFWGRIVLLGASDLVLQGDAILVSWAADMPRLGNTISSPDGTSFVWIAAPCSSLTNVSLAILCWVLFTQGRGVRWSVRNLYWSGLACAAVVAVNVIRLTLLVLRPDDFTLIHGPVGANTASWLTIALTGAICAYGTQRGRTSSA